jgi:hypothetical protein
LKICDGIWCLFIGNDFRERKWYHHLNWTGNLFSSKKKKINKKVEKFKTFWHKVAQFFHLNTQWLWKLTFLYNFLLVHLQNSLIWKRFIYSLSKNSKNKVTKGKWSVNKPQTVKKEFLPFKAFNLYGQFSLVNVYKILNFMATQPSISWAYKKWLKMYFV